MKLSSFPIQNHRFYNNQFNTELNKLKNVITNHTVLTFLNKDERLEVILKVMINNHGILFLLKDNYLNRLTYELEKIIRSNNHKIFDYLLYYEDIALYFHDRNKIANVGRGSATCSLVNFLLGITKIDPVYFNLPFERFFHKPNRISISFDCDNRMEILEYLIRKYPNLKRIKTKMKHRLKPTLRYLLRQENLKYSQIEDILEIINKHQEIRELKTFKLKLQSDQAFYSFIKENNQIFSDFMYKYSHIDRELIRTLDSIKCEGLSPCSFVITDEKNEPSSEEVIKDNIAEFSILGRIHYHHFPNNLDFKAISNTINNDKNFTCVKENLEDIPKFHNAYLEMVKSKEDQIQINSLIEMAMITFYEANSKNYQLFASPIQDNEVVTILEETKNNLIFQEQFIQILNTRYELDPTVAMNLYLASSKKELSLDEFANQLNPDSNDDFKFIQFLYLTSHYLVPKGHFIADSVINYILAWNPSKKIKNLLHIADSDID